MANVVKKGGLYLQLTHLDPIVVGVSDFSPLANAAAAGAFIDGAGDGTTYDYVDLDVSMDKPATNISIFLSSTAGTELLIVMNPKDGDVNAGMDMDRTHRILCEATQSVSYTIAGAGISGFNIDYNGAFSGGVANIDKLVITIG